MWFIDKKIDVRSETVSLRSSIYEYIEGKSVVKRIRPFLVLEVEDESDLWTGLMDV